MKPVVLEILKRRLGGWLLLKIVLLLIGVALGLALGFILVDAAIDLPDPTRVLAPWVVAAAMLLLALSGIWQWRKYTEQRLARLFETADPGLGNRLTNAVQLSERSGSTAVEEFLRKEAVELGRKAAAGVAVWQAVRRGVKMSAGVAGAAVVAFLLLFIVSADLLQSVLPRFLDPHGDHPPYSRLKFEVSPGKSHVLYGAQLEVRAKVGPGTAGADKLWLVAKSGTNVLRAMMFLAPDKSFFQTLANLREPTEYYVTDGRARSHRFPVAIRYTPQIALVEVTTTYPEYTGKPARTARLSEEPQAMPEDTQVAFRVISNRPLKSGDLTLTPVLGGKVQHVELKTDAQQNAVTGSFKLTEPVVFSIKVRDVSDLDSAEPKQGRFNISPDERPRLFVLEPGRDAVATPSIRVPIRVQANDDYGVTRVAWLRGLNRSIERPFAMKIDLRSGPQNVEATNAFDFEKLGVRPGDIIEYYFEAADNYPKGPNLALSRIYRLQIISKEQYEMVLRQAAARKALFEPYFQLGTWLSRMAERARNMEQQAKNGTNVAQDAEALKEDLDKYAEELKNLLQQSLLFDVEQAFRDVLAGQLGQIAEARQSLNRAFSGAQFDPGELVKASELLSELTKQEQEQVSEPARQIAAVAHLLARADTFVKLAQQQAALAKMLRRFADKTDGLTRTEQMEMQELADHQRRIEQGLQALLSSLPELLAKVPEEADYDQLRTDVEAFIQAVADEKIPEDLAANAKHFAALDGKNSHALAEQIAEKMDRLISRCNGMQAKGKMCLRFQPSISQGMGNTLEQILAAMGANTGAGEDGRDGYGLYNDDVALYGPGIDLVGQQAGPRGDSRTPGRRGAELVSGQTREPDTAQPMNPARVKLQPDARFPLRYRDLVGEYFRVIGESETRTGGKQ